MSYSEFWEGDVHSPKFYMEAYKQRAERERQQMNFNAWLNGFYVTKAHSVVLGNAFAKKNTTPAEYFSEPVPLTDSDKKRIENKVDPEQELLRTQLLFNNWMNAFKKN